MEDRLYDLYRIPEGILPQDICLQDLSEQCARLEERVRQIIDVLPYDEQQIIKAYIDMRDEMEFQSVKTALRFGKKSR